MGVRAGRHGGGRGQREQRGGDTAMPPTAHSRAGTRLLGKCIAGAPAPHSCPAPWASQLSPRCCNGRAAVTACPVPPQPCSPRRDRQRPHTLRCLSVLENTPTALPVLVHLASPREPLWPSTSPTEFAANGNSALANPEEENRPGK